MNEYYGGGPRPLVAADPHEGITIAELAEWIAALRADGAPDEAPMMARTNLRAGLKRVELVTGVRLAASLRRRAQRRTATEGTSADEDRE